MELAPLVHHVRGLAAVEPDPDRQLLERYLAGDGGAFTALVRRHGPMVLGVCRRVLGHEQDAEDAFQATFLALAVRPGAVRNREAAGSFLHGVALRIARKARSRRRRTTSNGVLDRPAPEALPDWMRAELAAVLDEEIVKLPEWCREAFVLCHLQGQSVAQTARRLGCPRGTVLSRLARARQRLAQRLRERGITPGVLTVPALPSLLEETTAEWGACALAGQATTSFVSRQVLALTLYGGKMGKIIPCFLLLALTVCFGAATAVAIRSEVREEPRPETPAPAAIANQDRKETARPGKKGKADKPEPESRLDVVLRKWAAAEDSIRSMRYQFTQTENDKVFQKTNVSRGDVQILKPHLLRINHREGARSTVFLFTEKTIHWYDSAQKTERIFKKPVDGSFLGEKTPDPSWSEFLSGKVFGNLFQQQMYWIYAGLPVRDLPRRFRVAITKEDAWYVYLDLQPRTTKDRCAFERMRVVLEKEGFQVRQIWQPHPNGNELTLDFEKHDTKTKITPASIRERLPRGWKRIAFPLDLNQLLPEK